MALSDYQIALNNYNAAMNADPVIRALIQDHGAWGDIMYDEDMRNNATRPREIMIQVAVPNIVMPTPPAGGEPRQFRSWNSQPQRQSRFDQRPPRHDQQTRQPAPKPQAPVAQKQQKRPRNAFAALDEDSE